VVFNQSRQAATATVRGTLHTDDGSAMAEIVAPLPKPLRLTAGARGWRLSEVLAWIEGLQREGEEHSREARHEC
jgi:hypothetical protein